MPGQDAALPARPGAPGGQRLRGEPGSDHLIPSRLGCAALAPRRGVAGRRASQKATGSLLLQSVRGRAAQLAHTGPKLGAQRGICPSPPAGAQAPARPLGHLSRQRARRPQEHKDKSHSRPAHAGARGQSKCPQNKQVNMLPHAPNGARILERTQRFTGSQSQTERQPGHPHTLLHRRVTHTEWTDAVVLCPFRKRE